VDPRLSDLLKLLELEQLEVNLFRGESRDIGSTQVFGGQVLSQALTAAHATVDPGRMVHSLHAYFLRRGDFNARIVYSVDRSRDGHSFSNRRIVAIQHGEPIFNMTASFQIMEAGLEHQLEMPTVPGPETLLDATKLSPELMAKLPPKVQRFLSRPIAFEFRHVQSFDFAGGGSAPPRRQVWLRAVGVLPDDEALHRCLLSYVSDIHLLDTALLPHGGYGSQERTIMASIDHAMWFHRRIRVDDWLLYDVDSPSASGARGFARANLYTRDGVLVASTAQEGLMRRV